MPAAENEGDSKLNLLVRNAHRIWKETGDATYRRPEGKGFDLPDAVQMIFSDLGTINVEKKRGFSAYRFICDELIRLGVARGLTSAPDHFSAARRFCSQLTSMQAAGVEVSGDALHECWARSGIASQYPQSF